MVIKKFLKSWIDSFPCTQSPFMDKIMKNKKGLELVTTVSLS